MGYLKQLTPPELTKLAYPIHSIRFVLMIKSVFILCN